MNPHPPTIPSSCLKTKFWIGPTACGSTQSCLHQDLNKPHDANFCNPPCIYVHYLILQFYMFKVCHWRQCIWHPSVILLAESQPGLSDTANLTFTTRLVLQTTTCTFFCLSARINPILSLMYFPCVIQSTCQRSEPACSCSSFRTGWTWVGVGSTWYVVPYPPLSLLTLTPLSSRGVLLVLQSPFILTRSAAETVLHPFLVSDCLASQFKLYKASDTTSDSSQICRVLTQTP